MSVTVITTVSELDHPGLARLRASLPTLLPLWVHHCPQWKGWGYKLRAAARAARELDSTHLLWADGYDTMCLGSQNEIDTVAADVDTLLCSTERACWPHPDLAKRYPLQARTSYQFICAGMWIASRAWVLAQGWETFDYLAQSNDQVYLTDRFLRGQIDRDDACVLFQSMGHSSVEDFDYDGGRVIQRESGTRPVFLHFNGRTDPLPFLERL